MSRSGYVEDHHDNWTLIRWRGAVKSAIRGRRGQAFLAEILAAMDALPEKKLIAGELFDADGACCALGAVAKGRGIPQPESESGDTAGDMAALFSIPRALAAEIMSENDEWGVETPEHRFDRVRRWVVEQIESASKQEAPQ